MYLLYEKPSKAYLWGTSLITRDDTYCVVCICSHYFKLSQSVTIIVRLEKTLLYPGYAIVGQIIKFLSSQNICILKSYFWKLNLFSSFAKSEMKQMTNVAEA